MNVSGITEQVAEILQDETNVTWTEAQLIAWVNDAIRALVNVRPDASSTTAAIQLTANTTKQALSATGDQRLIRLTRNMGAAGATPGKAIVLVDMATMDAINPDWHTDTAGTRVKEYMYNEERPKEFWVYPKPATAFYVEVIKSVLPTAVTAVGDPLPVDDIYAPALIEWVCYRAFSRDSEETPNWVRAARHFTAFFNVLQVKMKSDMAINPKFREKVKEA